MSSNTKKINHKFEEAMLLVLNEPERTFDIGRDLLAEAKSSKDELSIAKAYLLQSFSGFFLGIHGLSFEYVNQALPIFIKYRDKKNEAAAYNTLGYIYDYFDDHESRLEINLKSLELRKEVGNATEYTASLINTGDSYLSLNKLEKALEYFNKSLENTPLQNLRQRAITTSNIAETYYRLKEFKKANTSLEMSNEICSEIELQHICTHNKIIQARILNDQKEYQTSVDLLNQFIAKSSDINDDQLAEINKEISISYEYLNEFEKSLESIKKHHTFREKHKKEKQEKDLKSLKFRKKINQLEDKTKTLESLVNIRTNELEMALESEKIISFFSRELNDSLTIYDALWKITKNIISQLKLVDCVIYMVDFDKNKLIQRAAFGPKNIDYVAIHEPIEIEVGEGIVGSVALNGVHELIDDTRKNEQYIVDDQERRSELAVPVFYKKKVIGVIDSEHPKTNFFNKRHLYIFNMIASLLESHYSRLQEQEIKENLQKEVLSLNSNLENEIQIKSKENIDLNHKIVDQEKKVIIGEIAAIIAHEMNTPLASIKAGSEAILFLMNRIIQIQSETPFNKNDLSYISPRIAPLKDERISSDRITRRENIEEIKSKIKTLNLNFEPHVIQQLAKLNLKSDADFIDLVLIKNPSYTLDLLHDINSMYGFNHSLIEMSKKTNNSISNLKSLVLSEEKKEKKKIKLETTFYGLQQHIRLQYPEVELNFNINESLNIFAFDFQTIQLWSNILSLIMENVVFKATPLISFESFENGVEFGVVIYCNVEEIKSNLFSEKLLQQRFNEKLDNSVKLKLNIIKTLVDDHNAMLNCSSELNKVKFKLTFNELN
ncbi:GAF domain-containing protein [Crocinitomicaceae bacterium]|nr:GAF domain-containing protein [Crocinitomicaceae bacterium]MDB4606400.1 GAF domain-containing protein [Crocinitomicaceae bacterium]